MTKGTTITITIGETVLDGRLWDNATAQDLVARLPLTLHFRDFNRVEKIGRLPKKLTLDGVPKGDDPESQDIGYYTPTNDLVFYYDDVGYYDGIVRLGVFENDLSAIRNQPEFIATLELRDRTNRRPLTLRPQSFDCAPVSAARVMSRNVKEYQKRAREPRLVCKAQDVVPNRPASY